MKHLATYYNEIDRLEEAAPLLKDMVGLRAKTLAKDHADTTKSVQGLNHRRFRLIYKPYFRKEDHSPVSFASGLQAGR